MVLKGLSSENRMLPEEPHNFSTADKGQITKKSTYLSSYTLFKGLGRCQETQIIAVDQRLNFLAMANSF